VRVGFRDERKGHCYSNDGPFATDKLPTFARVESLGADRPILVLTVEMDCVFRGVIADGNPTPRMAELPRVGGTGRSAFVFFGEVMPWK